MKAIERMKQVVSASRAELQARSSMTHSAAAPGAATRDNETHSAKRRAFLRKSMATAGGAGALGLAGGAALAAPLAIPESNKQMGRPLPPEEYGMPSKFEAHVKRRRTDVLVNQNWNEHWHLTQGDGELRAVAGRLAVRAPVGKHRFVLRYRPRSFVVGEVLSFVSLVVALGLVVWRRYRRRRRPV